MPEAQSPIEARTDSAADSVEVGSTGRVTGWQRWSVLLLALPLLFYCSLPTRNFYWDGVAFALDIEKGLPAAALLHPSHLSYALWGSWLYQFCGQLGLGTRALFAM